MAKNILAFFGMVFLTLLIGGSVMLMGHIYDSIGLVTLPEGIARAPETVVEFFRALEGANDEVKITTSGGGKVEWTNPLELIPKASPTFAPTPTAIPTPTQTPVPPLSASEYRGRVMAALKTFVAALERWLDSNERLTTDMALMQDTAWREEAFMSLEQITTTAQELAAVGPPPEEYAVIDGLLDQVSYHAGNLTANYQAGLESGDPQYLAAAGENFNEVKDTLTQAVEQMVLAGWSVE